MSSELRKGGPEKIGSCKLSVTRSDRLWPNMDKGLLNKIDPIKTFSIVLKPDLLRLNKNPVRPKEKTDELHKNRAQKK